MPVSKTKEGEKQMFILKGIEQLQNAITKAKKVRPRVGFKRLLHGYLPQRRARLQDSCLHLQGRGEGSGLLSRRSRIKSAHRISQTATNGIKYRFERSLIMDVSRSSDKNRAKNKMRKSVEILQNKDGSYSIYLYSRETFRGTLEECNAEIVKNAMYW